MTLRVLILFALYSLSGASYVFAQDATGQSDEAARERERDPRFVQNTRGNIPIPTNPEELRLVSLDLWLKFRRTNQRLYSYINEAAEFRAYSYLCKRHDLNVNLEPINQLVDRHLQQIIIAHYDEPDYAVLEKLSKAEQAELMTDISGDLYAFEYGYRVAQQNSVIETAGSTTNNYCSQAEKTYYQKYIALLATARRQTN